jgi:CheY-like chemotaxis protein
VKRSALVVDDDDLVRTILPVLLEEQQYDAEVADGPEKALDIIAQRRFDVIFTDYEMPGMNGLELARIVREVSPGSRIILMTGLLAADLFLGSQADGYLQKPFSVKALREVLGGAARENQ